MKSKVLAIIIFVVLGAASAFSVYSSSDRIQSEYDKNISMARKNAKDDIPYVSIDYYKKAFSIKNDDEEIYKEYLTQLKSFDEKMYKQALNEYSSIFSNSQNAYETLANSYYTDMQYKEVLEVYNTAKENGIKSDALEQLRKDSIYKFTFLKTGLQSAKKYIGGCALIQVNDKWGCLNSNGAYILSADYDAVQTFVAETTPVKKDGKWIIVNNKGYKVAVPSKQVEYLGFANQGMAVVKDNKKYGYADSEYNIPDKLTWDYASNVKNDVAAVKKDGKWCLIDNKQKQITELIYDDIKLDEYDCCINNGIIFAKQDGKYIMLDNSGKRVGKLSFDDVQMFESDNPAAVKVNNKWGYVFKDGTYAVEPKYTKPVKSYSINIAPFYDGSKWGYMDSEGKTVIEPQFDDCFAFSDDGIAVVKQGESYSYIKLIVYS